MLRSRYTVAVKLFWIFAAAGTAVAFYAGPCGAQAAPQQGQSGGIARNNIESGRRVFEKLACGRCHGAEGQGLEATASKVAALPIASTPLSISDFIESVRRPGGRMPAYSPQQVSDAELVNVYAFLRAAKPAVAQEPTAVTNSAHGAKVFAQDGCAECHLSHGQGSRVTGPRVGPPQLPLAAFIDYVRRPTGEMPPYTGKVVSDAELKEMYAFLQSAPQPQSWKTIPLLSQ